nr:immunoglobulin light chain junction region [Macaca mulatta]
CQQDYTTPSLTF